MARTAVRGGTCADCGQVSAMLWSNRYVVMESGFPGDPPMEPDMTEPDRCDVCETRYRVRDWYANAPELARRIYCADTAEAALRIMGY